MSWEQSRDGTTGYLTEWRDVGRWRLTVAQQWHGWQWTVTKARDTMADNGSWYDLVGIRTEPDRKAAKLVGGMVLRAAVMTKTRARKLARQATAHGYYYANHRAAAYCPQCKERVEVQVRLDRLGNRETVDHALTRCALAQLHAGLEAHLIESCEFVPERTVNLILGGRTHA
jgi:hypothetical protein